MFIQVSVALLTSVLQFASIQGHAAAVLPRDSQSGSRGIKNLVVFGDSYTDACNTWRLAVPSNVSAEYPFPSCPAPPTARWSGGRTWPELFTQATGVATHNFAFSAATCSNKVFKRYQYATNGSSFVVPGVDEQIDYFAKSNLSALDFDTAVGAIFIGTNDVNFVTNALQYNPPNEDPGSSTIVDEAQCVANRVRQLRNVGFKQIVIFKNIPLERTPYFSRNTLAGYNGPSIDGSGPSFRLSQNGTAVEMLVREVTLANNALQSLLVFGAGAEEDKSNVTFFDTHSLFTNLLDNPTDVYGSNANTTGFCNVCPIQASVNCTLCGDLNSFAWYDPLHPSEASTNQIGKGLAAHLGVAYENPL